MRRISSLVSGRAAPAGESLPLISTRGGLPGEKKRSLTFADVLSINARSSVVEMDATAGAAAVAVRAAATGAAVRAMAGAAAVPVGVVARAAGAIVGGILAGEDIDYFEKVLNARLIQIVQQSRTYSEKMQAQCITEVTITWNYSCMRMITQRLSVPRHYFMMSF